jgi:hypothetical protein
MSVTAFNNITLGDGHFKKTVDGERVGITADPLNVVIVNAAKLARTYYEAEYDPTNPSAPTCWSLDTIVPSSDVPSEQRQAHRCMSCEQNIKGSSKGGGRACRYSQRLAIVLEEQMDTIYQLRIPATSIFGKAKDGNMPMQAYAKYLHGHKTNSISVVTQISFDTSSTMPKLFFKALRALDDEERIEALKQKGSPAASMAALQTMVVLEKTSIDKSPFKVVDGFKYEENDNGGSQYTFN